MTDSNTALAEVPALLEERRRYESWLVALDARRDTTPAHVFQRVQSDYRGRLAAVAERLASHRQAIEEERASVQSRRSLLEAEEQMRRDERAELTLRAHVGELGESESRSAFAAVDGSIEQLVSEKSTLDLRIAELNEMLVDGPPVTQNSAAAEAAPAVASTQPERAPEPEIAAPSTDRAPAVAEQAAAAAPRPSGQAQLRRPFTPIGSFDDMAFLDSLVGGDTGRRSGAMPAPAPDAVDTNADGGEGSKRSPTPAAAHASPAAEQREPVAVASSMSAASSPDVVGRIGDRQAAIEQPTVAGDEAERRNGEPPLALNVTGNRPIVLRPSSGAELSKTLKCNECGALNYPTEWYCERCGAELAAL